MKVVIDEAYSKPHSVPKALIEVTTSRVTICKQNKNVEGDFPVMLQLDNVPSSTFAEWKNTKDVDFALYGALPPKDGIYHTIRVSLSKNVRCAIVD